MSPPSSPPTASRLRCSSSSACTTSPTGGKQMQRMERKLALMRTIGSSWCDRPLDELGWQRSVTTCPPQQPTCTAFTSYPRFCK
eukprot:CAMPEP_0177753682 /NCGR_PEP_ID=MMETSP0491_2-20121128/1593_1 /TAXON_ID=63592 /ORGANISM="Tetraselmis chuii, Strain PLY429" /LENGTH=83 /DNA_ID=CAMNT_0019268989 /DNA_START=672 /DNA_END=923 /DNA_ORIENTATION=-